MKRRRGRLARATAALLAVPACGAATFHSTTPHVAQDPDLRVSVEGLGVLKPIHSDAVTPLVLRVDAEIAVRPGAAWGTPYLGKVAGPACGGGLRATGDATFTAGGPAQQTVLSFADPSGGAAVPFAGGTAALDVPVFPAERSQPGRCLRVPLQTATGGTEWRASPWLIGLGFRVAFLARPLRGYEGSALLFDLQQGGWLRGFRIAAGFQGGLVDERGVAPTNPPASARPSIGLLGVDAQLGRMLWSGRHLGLDAQLGYDLLFTVAPDASSDPEKAAAYEKALLHGPRLALRILGLMGVRPDWPGFVVPPDATSAGLSLFAAAWWQSSGSIAPAPVFGFSLDGNVGL